MDKNEKSRVKNGNDWKCHFCEKSFCARAVYANT